MEDSVIIRCIGNSNDPDAFIAITHWRVLWANDKVSLVEAIPETGRTHQLRVHFSHLSHPIIGDDIYGRQSEHISRHALHAYSLTIPMPYTDEPTSFLSMPPTDMSECFKMLSNKDLSEQIQSHKEQE